MINKRWIEIKAKDRDAKQEWILKEYRSRNSSSLTSLSILVYEEQQKPVIKLFGKFKVWIGMTKGNSQGRYFGFEEKLSALKFAELLTHNKTNSVSFVRGF
jgi:hypothetical protein